MGGNGAGPPPPACSHWPPVVGAGRRSRRGLRATGRPSWDPDSATDRRGSRAGRIALCLRVPISETGYRGAAFSVEGAEKSDGLCTAQSGGPAPLASPGNPREPLAPPRSHLGDGLASELRETLGLGLTLHGENSRAGRRGGKRRLPEAEKDSAKTGPPRRGQTSNLGFTAEPELGGEGSAVVNEAGGAPGSPDPTRAQLLPEIVLRCRPARAPGVPTPEVGIRPPVRHRGPPFSALVPGRPPLPPALWAPRLPRKATRTGPRFVHFEAVFLFLKENHEILNRSSSVVKKKKKKKKKIFTSRLEHSSDLISPRLCKPWGKEVVPLEG
ncbi:uncharacterized protein [Macaca fascicularis]|uniref:uncharacterized protein n=1 Tax=Macaca fascicularis TaxID=9541 RepID=UPI0032B0563A